MMEQKNDATIEHSNLTNPKPRYTYLLVGNHDPITLNDLIGHLKDTLGRNIRLSIIYNGAYRVTCDTQITRKDIGLENVPLVLFEGTVTEPERRPELIFYSNDKVTLYDLVKAGVKGVTGVRKWAPNRSNKKPNRGYTAYFFNEDFTAYAYSKEAFLVRSSTVIFKVNSPPPALLPDGVSKNEFVKNRDSQLSAHRLTLSDQWNDVVYNVFESLVSILPEPKADLPEEFQTQLLELKADHPKSNSLYSLLRCR